MLQSKYLTLSSMRTVIASSPSWDFQAKYYWS